MLGRMTALDVISQHFGSFAFVSFCKEFLKRNEV
jgi:hypothetical protein